MTNFKTWIKKAGVRAIKTVAQSAVAMIGTAAVLSDVDWKMTVSAAILAGVLSILTSIAGLPEVKDDAEALGIENVDAEKGVDQPETEDDDNGYDKEAI